MSAGAGVVTTGAGGSICAATGTGGGANLEGGGVIGGAVRIVVCSTAGAVAFLERFAIAVTETSLTATRATRVTFADERREK